MPWITFCCRRHRDTREVFMIFGSRVVNNADNEVSAAFLEEVRPFERARIWSGLRDLVAMDVFETSESLMCSRLDVGVVGCREENILLALGENFDLARRASSDFFPGSEVDLSHLRR